MYSELVLENPRPYDVAIYYTVRTGCDDCNTILEEFSSVAHSYINADKPSETPCFFGVFYYNADPKVREIFNSHNFKTVPYLAVSKNQVKRDPAADFFETRDIWLIKKDEASDNQILLNFVNKRLQNDIPLKIPFLTVLFNNIVLFLMLGAAIVTVFSIRPVLINP